MVHFDQNLFGKTKSSQATLRIIVGMEVPVSICVKTVKTLLDNPLIQTWSDKSTKYHITPYDHIMDL